MEFILNLARDLGVNIAGIAIILQMRERMEEMNRQMQGFVDYVRTEMLSRMQHGVSESGGCHGAAAALRRRLLRSAKSIGESRFGSECLHPRRIG